MPINTKEFLKPAFFKIFIFLFIGIIFLYFAKESTCAAGFYLAFCYEAHGFPFFYAVSGDIDAALGIGYPKEMLLGNYFIRRGNSLFNPIAFLLDTALIYVLACFLSPLFKRQN